MRPAGWSSLAWPVWLFSLSMLLGHVGAARAHHGGLGIEGDLVEWALKVDQWQAEGLDQGYRIKFLSYPRQPVLDQPTRLVFEIQSAATGQYVSGLKAQVQIHAPDGSQRLVPLPETTGVTAYYETTLSFALPGVHTITFLSMADGASFQSAFQKDVSRSALFGDWPTLTGHLVVLAAFTVTWISMVLAVQRRFSLLSAPPLSTPTRPDAS